MTICSYQGIFKGALKGITVKKCPHLRFQTQYLPLSRVWSNSMSTFPKQQLVIKPIQYLLGIELSPNHAQFGVLGV